ncbi:shikimate dehydrogenase [bacterium]|nr:shikimate dehydrogenase [bacterium]
MNDDQRTQYGVIGHPVGQSFSPAIHSFIGERTGFPLTYGKRSVRPQELPSFVRESRRPPWGGYSVTLPHKETIIPLLDGLDPSAEAVGAVNTVVRRGKALTGYNTDAAGLRDALLRSGVKTAARAVIVGAGGAARAGLAALADMGCIHVTLLNRTAPRSGPLITDFRERFPSLNSDALTPAALLTHLRTADLLINATPLGMLPDTKVSLLPDGSLLHPETTVMDMVPNPPRTLLLQQAEKQGCRTVSGLDMLIAQAVAAQEIWQNRPLPAELFDAVKIRFLELRNK